MSRRKIFLLGMILTGALSLTACSGVHDFLNPPPFTPPVDAAPPQPSTPVPTYVAPGTVIDEKTIVGSNPTSISFVSKSPGFTARLSCNSKVPLKTKLSFTAMDSTKIINTSCSTAPNDVFKIAFPGVDDSGTKVKLIVTVDGQQGTTAKMSILSGAY